MSLYNWSFYMSASVAMTWVPFKIFLAALSKPETNEERTVK